MKTGGFGELTRAPPTAAGALLPLAAQALGWRPAPPAPSKVGLRLLCVSRPVRWSHAGNEVRPSVVLSKRRRGGVRAEAVL